MTWPELSTPVPVTVAVGTVRTRLRQFVRRVSLATYATAVVGGFAAVLMPWGLTAPWLVALCGVVFVTWLAVGTHADARWTGTLELALEHEPRHLVVRGPWQTRRHTLEEVAAIQLWCDCGSGLPTVDPHRDGLDVLLRTGVSFRVEPTTAFAPDVGPLLRELLEPSGVKVVDWGWTDADHS